MNSNDDFRSILHISQIAQAYQKRIVSAEPLIGKKYALYPRGQPVLAVEHITDKERVNLQFDEDFREPFAFFSGLLCTAKSCSQLIRFSEREILEFDPRTGNLTAWWIER